MTQSSALPSHVSARGSLLGTLPNQAGKVSREPGGGRLSIRRLVRRTSAGGSSRGRAVLLISDSRAEWEEDAVMATRSGSSGRRVTTP
jgi:hypothetical protein